MLSSIFGKTNGRAISVGMFECTKGLKLLASGNFSLLSLPIACAIVSFGGLSVIVQSTAFLKKAKIKIAPFVLSKVLSAILAFLFGLLSITMFICGLLNALSDEPSLIKCSIYFAISIVSGYLIPVCIDKI